MFTKAKKVNLYGAPLTNWEFFVFLRKMLKIQDFQSQKLLK